MIPPDNSTYCPTGKRQYKNRIIAGREAAALNQHDKRHKHSCYQCKECGLFHTTTLTKRTLRVPKKLDKYPIKYTMPVKEEERPKKKKKRNRGNKKNK